MRKTSVRNYVHLLIICIPLLLLLIACIFPNKQTNNIYSGNITEEYNNTRAYDFNQLNNYNALETGVSYSIDDGLLSISGNYSSSTYLPISTYNRINGHKYLLRTIGFNNPTGLKFYASNSSNVISTDYDYIFFNESLETGISYIRLYVYGDYMNTTFNLSCYVNLFDLTQIFGQDNEPLNIEDFNKVFPKEYYEYTLSEDIMKQVVITQIVINDTDNVYQVNETKQINTNIIKPINDFYNLSINDWYRNVLSFVGIDYDSNNIVKTYIAYQPLWLMWFFLLEIIEIVLTAVPRLLILICKKIGGDEV